MLQFLFTKRVTFAWPSSWHISLRSLLGAPRNFLAVSIGWKVTKHQIRIKVCRAGQRFNLFIVQFNSEGNETAVKVGNRGPVGCTRNFRKCFANLVNSSNRYTAPKQIQILRSINADRHSRASTDTPTTHPAGVVRYRGPKSSKDGTERERINNGGEQNDTGSRFSLVPRRANGVAIGAGASIQPILIGSSFKITEGWAHNGD